MAQIPNDPVLLLSFINTELRDFYSSLDELCEALMLDRGHIESKLKGIDYTYDGETNRFV